MVQAVQARGFAEPTTLVELPDPEPGPGEVLVDVLACAVGLTTRNMLRGDLGDDPRLLPLVPGHELVGTVSGVGPGVTSRWLGQRVTAHFYLFCGLCLRCLAGEEPLCEALEGMLGVHRPGALAEKVCLPARNLVALPEHLDPVGATVVPDALVTPVHVRRRAGIGPGDRVAVLGAGGGVGVHMVQVARLAGASVVGLDVVPAKLSALEDRLGIPALDASDLERVRLPGRWREGADVVVDLVGSPATLAWATRQLAPGGRLALLTTFPGITGSFAPRDLVLRQLAVVGSRHASRAELHAAARLLADGLVDPVVGATGGLPEAGDLLERVVSGAVLGRAAVVVRPVEDQA
jgi:D-arabinose 1-dehydrogenase-like Zn-dependent alcohol dehydrogenase